MIMEMEKVTIGDYAINVTKENAEDFQNAIDTLLILVTMSGMNLGIEEIKVDNQQKLTIIISSHNSDAVRLRLEFKDNSESFYMDTIWGMNINELIKIREQIVKEFGDHFFSKRLGGLMIGAETRTSNLEKCMIETIKKMHIKA